MEGNATVSLLDSERCGFRKLASETHTNYLESTHRYLSEICAPKDGAEIIALIKEFRKLSRPSISKSFRLVSVHNTHVHVVHACNYANTTCRCYWLQVSHIWRRTCIHRHRRRICIADLTVDDWTKIFNISLQMATQSKTLKAEVQMEDFIYNLKIYK